VFLKDHLQGYFFILLLSIIIVFSRLIYKSIYLYEWDSIQFALAIDKIDIVWHQPHPPGYMFYVALIKLAYIFINDHNNAMIASNIFISIATVIVFYKHSFLLLKSYVFAFLSSLLLAFNPNFWFNGSTATIYTAEAFITTANGYLLWRMNPNSKWNLFFSSMLIGLLSGLRPTALLFVFPLWFFTLARKKILNIKTITYHGSIILLMSLIWLIPTIMNTQGIANYYNASSSLTGNGHEKLISFFGSNVNYLLTNITSYMMWMVQSLSPFGVLFLCLSLLWILNKRVLGIEKEYLLFFLYWITPSLIFYVFFLDKFGYLLSIIPPFLLLISYLLMRGADRCSRKNSYILLFIYSVILLFFIIWFVYPSFDKDGKPNKLIAPAFIVQPPMSDSSWDISSREILHKNFLIDESLKYLKGSDITGSSTTTIFWFGGSPTWRHLSYYLPSHHLYWLVNYSNSGYVGFNSDYYYSHNNLVSSYSGLPFWWKGYRPKSITIELPSQTSSLILIAKKNSKLFDKYKQDDDIVRSYFIDQEMLLIDRDKNGVQIDEFYIK
jgi:hypothetical protein